MDLGKFFKRFFIVVFILFLIGFILRFGIVTGTVVEVVGDEIIIDDGHDLWAYYGDGRQCGDTVTVLFYEDKIIGEW